MLKQHQELCIIKYIYSINAKISTSKITNTYITSFE